MSTSQALCVLLSPTSPSQWPRFQPDLTFIPLDKAFLRPRVNNLSQVQMDCTCCFSLSKCPVTPLGKEIKLAWLSGCLAEGRSRLHATVLPSFRWLQIDYVTVCSIPTEILSWLFNDYEDKACLFFSDMSIFISISHDFKDAWWLPWLSQQRLITQEATISICQPAWVLIIFFFFLNYNLPTVQ